jgi:hypothetical protein
MRIQMQRQLLFLLADSLVVYAYTTFRPHSIDGEGDSTILKETLTQPYLLDEKVRGL